MATQRAAGLSGISAAVLFGAASALWALDMPEAGAPVAEIAGFYRDTSGRIVAGASLSLVALAGFVLFAAALRQVLAEAEGDDLLAMTAFGGLVVGVAAGLGAETINMVGALRARDGELSDALAQSLFEISQILGSTAAGVGIGIFVLATATVALRSGLILPRWLAILTGMVGIALLSPLSRVQEVPGAALVSITLLIAVLLLRTPVEEDALDR
jgi:hypothetical protein